MVGSPRDTSAFPSSQNVNDRKKGLFLEGAQTQTYGAFANLNMHLNYNTKKRLATNLDAHEGEAHMSTHT